MPLDSEIRGDRILLVAVPGQPTAGTADDFVGFVAPFNMKIIGVKWIPAAAIAANGTNYFTMNLRNRGAAGAGATAIATRSYVATNSTANVAEAMTLSGTAADLNVAAGDVITVDKVNTGTGLAMPDGVVQVTYQAR